jgi:G3E family GTPase
VEASGVADPATLARLIRYSGVDRVRPGGVVDVVDAVEHFGTIDLGGLAPARYATASLVVINKTDRIPPAERDAVVARIIGRIRERNLDARIIETSLGRIDPALVFDAAQDPGPDEELSFASLIDADADADAGEHAHADAVTVPTVSPVDPDRLVDLLENPPNGVYRLKGSVTVGSAGRERRIVVNVVGRHVHVAAHPAKTGSDGLVAIGMHLDLAAVRARLQNATRPAPGSRTDDGLRRLTRLRRLSI